MTRETPEHLSSGDARSEILGDLRPVRPLAAPWKRALFVLAPWATAMLALVWSAKGLRPDLEVIGALASWGASALFVSGGFALAVFVLRESLPGARLPVVLGLGAILGILAAQVGTAAAIHALHPHPTPEGEVLRLVVACSGAIGALAAPLLLGLLYLIWRGYPTRLAWPGVAAGVAAVVAGEALWRLHCPFTSPGHLLTAHFLPYLAAAAVGVLLLRLRHARRRRA